MDLRLRPERRSRLSSPETLRLWRVSCLLLAKSREQRGSSSLPGRWGVPQLDWLATCRAAAVAVGRKKSTRV